MLEFLVLHLTALGVMLVGLLMLKNHVVELGLKLGWLHQRMPLIPFQSL